MSSLVKRLLCCFVLCISFARLHFSVRRRPGKPEWWWQVGGHSHEPVTMSRMWAGGRVSVITDNEMSPPEAHNGEQLGGEIINALEVEQIQIPLMLDKCTASHHVTIYSRPTPKPWYYFGCCEGASLNSNNNNKTWLGRSWSWFRPQGGHSWSQAPAYHGHQQNTTPVTLSHRICIRELIIHKLWNNNLHKS